MAVISGDWGSNVAGDMPGVSILLIADSNKMELRDDLQSSILLAMVPGA